MIKLTSLTRLARKLIKWDKSLRIYLNGENNDYPERSERFRINSKTALMASRFMVQTVLGKGFGKDFNDLKIKGSRLIEIAEDITRDLVNERGFFVHVNYNGAYEIDNFKVIPFKKCRIGEKDDKQYNGKILVSDNWIEDFKKDKIRVYDVYNPDPDIIASQVENAGSWQDYKGQVYYFNMDREFIYPLSRIHACFEDCDNEKLSSIYKNRVLRFGFFGKTIFITRPLVGKKPNSKAKPEAWNSYREMETEREEFKKTFAEFSGVNDYGNSMHMEIDFAGEKLEDAIAVKTIESKIDDKLFQYTDDSSRDGILMSYNNLPIDLVKSSGSSVFGSSGELIKAMKKSYQDSTEIERDILTRTLNMFWQKMPNRKNEVLINEKLIKDAEPTTDPPNN